MKKLISKIKKSCRNFISGKAAFSLVELIVVIAIMAVMAAVLAPALLGYVEKSRMQKDASAMDEVVNSIQLSLADQSIYDEVLEHSVWDNVSCYIDKKDESQFADCKVQLKDANGDKKEQYMFGDEARLLDETVYYAAGNMRGLTITFSPSESGDTYDFANGILNKFVGRKTGLLSENPDLYNRLRSVIGDKLDTTSQTYRNSDYTIFIRVGSTGGSEAVMQDAIQVWGQFNGTNLVEKDHKYELSSGRVVGSAGANDAANNQTNNENSNMDFSENPTKTLELTGIVGDISGNGEIDLRDLAIMRGWQIGDYPSSLDISHSIPVIENIGLDINSLSDEQIVNILSQIAQILGDCNKDGVVDDADLAYIRSYQFGKEGFENIAYIGESITFTITY